ncbi:MAG: gfo/Idh/MocA family oxidoreductase, partial [Candidatus Poribacteria bacterium]|nr:gfo/Idh/MocA family oxidoreductase [Candidatus Poribacteria bacterium]
MAIRLTFVGYGSIAHSHAKAFQKLGGVEFDAVVGRLPEPSKEFAAEYRFDFHTTDLREALARDSCD